ncbi:GRAS family transcription factor [Rhynchospora pubera]|uniref:GRAS family transcription factor n=1 Tax=Rhynchospora pubera TaxID=906938 RepID=A0AAV8FM09_9POAL|nr:GRAS family transcription factor [Rhynchospora pubera]
MAFMCTDSGNLMAIAQQVIAQQQQQHQRQQQEQFHQIQSSTASASWAPPPDHQSAFASAFSDPFSFPPPQSFKLSDEFDSDEWMDSLIGSGDLSPLFADPPLSTDLDRLIMPRGDVLTVDQLPQPVKRDKEPEPEPEPDPDPEPNSKVTVSCSSSQSLPSSSSSHPVLKSLLDCARLAGPNPDLAIKTLDQTRPLVSKLGDPIQRVGFYFTEALSVRLMSTTSPPPPSSSSSEEFTLCYKTLNDACPYSKFAHLTANQAILEATESATHIHINDFGVMQGIQWAAFLQALATRPGGKPTRVRISGIPSPSLGSSPIRPLSATGNRLREFAELLELNFEFIPIVTPVDQLTVSDFRVDVDECIAVNFMLDLYHLLDDSMERVQYVLRVAKSLNPEVVTLGEYEANLNRVGFVNRFANALSYYCSVFESIEPAMARDSLERVEVERVLFGNRILRAVGLAEGIERTDRMEESGEWMAQMEKSGFKSVQFSNYAISQAKVLLWNYDYSAKYSLVDSTSGFLSLAWDGKKLLTVSSWR